MEANTRGRKRKFCSQSCRQRSYEQRHQVQGTGIPADALILRPELAEQLHDELFELRCAAEDVQTAARDREDYRSIEELAEELVDIARRIEQIRGQR